MDATAQLQEAIAIAQRIMGLNRRPEAEQLDADSLCQLLLPNARLILAAPQLLKAARIALLILRRNGLQPLRGEAWDDSELKIIEKALAQAGEDMESLMSPNATLKELLALAHKIRREPRTEWIDPADASRLAELVIALDNWIRAGGFLPQRWQPPESSR